MSKNVEAQLKTLERKLRSNCSKAEQKEIKKRIEKLKRNI